MALRKVTDDELTTTGVKSTFTIDIPEDPSAQFPTTFTAICGWGWRFSCLVEATSTSTSPRLLDSNFNPIPWRRVTIFFDPALIIRAEYGRIKFHTQVENLRLLEDALFYAELNLSGNIPATVPLGVYIRRSDATGAAKISITVEFRAELGISLARPLDTRVEAALAETIQGEEVVDLKFYAYTRVGPSYVARPRPMFAKMALLRGHSEGLDEYLAGISREGFAESRRVDLDAHLPDEGRFTEYDYMSDSDLDSDDEESVPCERPSSPEPVEVKEILPNSVSVPSAAAPPTPRRMGNVVMVKSHAYKTWNAFLYYLYTKKLVFRTANSRGEPASRVLTCSAKSMYKLADAFGLTDLKDLALESVRSQLSPANIVCEAFSSFTSLYTEIQDIEVEFLLRHLPSLTEEVAEMLKSICEENRSHCFNVLQKVVFREAYPVPIGTHTRMAVPNPSWAPPRPLSPDARHAPPPQFGVFDREPMPMPPRSLSPTNRNRNASPRSEIFEHMAYPDTPPARRRR
ncbi:hypothetical protein B0H11DRAFT_2145779 [Mycena galericulata]|nr:hypothetical protein B0H11DRAFT_2145779 [Mycena galericulata]